ncbi:MAG: hypothetical protein GY769_08025 [bacterium]|nr:hypothetical protein [bacterium]
MSTKGKYPYMPWWLYDYNADPRVQAMTDDQDLAYRRMLEASWDLGALPTEPEKIGSLIRYSRRKFAAVWKYPLTDCWEKNGAGLSNPRLERERERVSRLYAQRRRAGKRSAEARKKGTSVERASNERSTSVERASNDPYSYSDLDGGSKIKRDIKKDLASIEGGGTGAPYGPPDAAPKPTAVTGRVKWNKEDQKLDASKSFKEEFLTCWKRHFSKDEIKGEMVKATRWLVKNPKRRGTRSRLDLYLHNWMEKALEDREAMEEEEEITSRPTPPVEPSSKWCRSCRETLPDHSMWCPVGKKERGEDDADSGKQGRGGDDGGDRGEAGGAGGDDTGAAEPDGPEAAPEGGQESLL